MIGSKKIKTNSPFKQRLPLGFKQELHSLHSGRGNIMTLSPKKEEQQKITRLKFNQHHVFLYKIICYKESYYFNLYIQTVFFEETDKHGGKQ